MKNLSLVAFMLFLASLVHAQQNLQNIGMSNFSLCQSNIAQSSTWSIVNNAASISDEEFSTALFINQPYIINGLNQEALAINIPTKFAGIGAMVHHFGFEDYQQYWVKAGLSKQLSRNMYGGLSINYQSLSYSDNGKESLQYLTVDISSLIKASEVLSIGVAFNNIAQAQLSDTYDRNVPSSFTAGICYEVSEDIEVLGALNKVSEQSLQANFGLSAHYNDHLNFNLGFGTYPYRAAFGFGVKFSGIQLDVASEYRQQLGFNPAIGLKYGI